MAGGDGAPDHGLAGTAAPASDRALSLSRPESIAALLFTSGSSGKPKLVQLSHRALVLNACRTARAAKIDGADRIASPLPLYHAGGLSSGLVLSLVTGALWCSQARFDAQRMLAEAASAGCTVIQGVPTMFKALVAASRADMPTSLRLGFAGGAHVASALSAEAIDALGLTSMCVTYGQSEFGPTIALACGREASELDSVGQPIEGAELRIVDPATGKVQPGSELGEIQVRGETCMTAYLDDPAATAAAVDAEGWLRTGDLGSIQDGKLRLFGRLKSLIIRGGENISPGEIEAALADAPGVQDVCAVGVPSSHWGETVCAIVQPAPACALDVEVIRAHAQARLARYKWPEHLLVWKELPLLSSGKVDRLAVRELAVAQTTALEQTGKSH